jgi:hypothetical protein
LTFFLSLPRISGEILRSGVDTEPSFAAIHVARIPVPNRVTLPTGENHFTSPLIDHFPNLVNPLHCLSFLSFSGLSSLLTILIILIYAGLSSVFEKVF